MSGSTAQIATGFEVGQRFPNLVLPRLGDGQPQSQARARSLANYRGEKSILHIFASW